MKPLIALSVRTNIAPSDGERTGVDSEGATEQTTMEHRKIAIELLPHERAAC